MYCETQELLNNLLLLRHCPGNHIGKLFTTVKASRRTTTCKRSWIIVIS